MKRTRLFIGFLFLTMISCNQRNQEDSARIYDFTGDTVGSEEKARQIFYSMYLPNEMSRLFERVGANFEPSILNSPENFARYTDPVNIALNLGIYGVDLNYVRMFDQGAATAKYFGIIQILADKLGIPKSTFEDLLMDMDEYFQNKDSLSKVAGEIYTIADEYLKEHGNDAYAALIVTGGWIEALYIATKIFEENPGNMEIMDRIAEQKYSLNSLISLLSNYQSDIKIAEYILMLKQIRKAFSSFEIVYDTQNLSIDTTQKLINAAEYHSGISAGVVYEIALQISNIRTEITN